MIAALSLSKMSGALATRTAMDLDNSVSNITNLTSEAEY